LRFDQSDDPGDLLVRTRLLNETDQGAVLAVDLGQIRQNIFRCLFAQFAYGNHLLAQDFRK
jgi:hypothetical protein